MQWPRSFECGSDFMTSPRHMSPHLGVAILMQDTQIEGLHAQASGFLVWASSPCRTPTQGVPVPNVHRGYRSTGAKVRDILASVETRYFTRFFLHLAGLFLPSCHCSWCMILDKSVRKTASIVLWFGCPVCGRSHHFVG